MSQKDIPIEVAKVLRASARFLECSMPDDDDGNETTEREPVRDDFSEGDTADAHPAITIAELQKQLKQEHDRRVQLQIKYDLLYRRFQKSIEVSEQFISGHLDGMLDTPQPLDALLAHDDT